MDSRPIEDLMMPATYGWHLTRLFPAEALFEGTGLRPADFNDPQQRITVRQALRYIENAIHLARDPAWYHAWASGLSDHFHGPLSLALMAAPNLGASLEAFCKYFPGRIPYLDPQVRDDGSTSLVEFTALIDLGSSTALLIETPVIILLEYLSSVYSVDLSRAAVQLAYPPTEYADRYARSFRCEVRFNAATHALVFPRDWKAIANVGYLASSWNSALQLCEATMGVRGERSTLGRVRAQLVAAMADTGRARALPTLKEVADKLFMSPRTVIRRLRAMGTSYQEMADDILKTRASELLANPKLKIKEVASALGFQNPANFGTAFRRWYRTSPGDYRSRLGDRADAEASSEKPPSTRA